MVFKDFIIEIINIFGMMTIDSLIEAFANMSLYAYPILMLFNAKLKTRKLSIKNEKFNSRDLTRVYVTETLFWVLMCMLYSVSLYMENDVTLNVLARPTMVVYFGLSWGLISIELKSIFSSYREVKSKVYVSAFKRMSFWVLALTSAFKVWRLFVGDTFGTPQQLMAIIDLLTYVAIFIALIVFLFFDKKKNVIQKAMMKSNIIVSMLKSNIIRNKKQIKRMNKQIEQVIELFDIGLSQVSDERQREEIEDKIKELQILLMVSN